MGKITGKNILLGVSGGIAAYKAAEMVRLLRKQGANIRVVMTHAATDFVGPLTFQALSGNAVHLDLLDSEQEAAMGHISLSRWADRILVTPATADFIAKIRIGIADDLLSTLCLAANAPIMLAPAMNQAMWRNPANQDNIETLKQRGIILLGPNEGEQACGETGFGRMLEPEDICAALQNTFLARILEGLSVLISAGPTREAIDPVRYISNRSSGKMGYSLAEAALEVGARITLVSGPVALSVPSVDEVVQVESAQEMFKAVTDRAESHDIYIGAAAVADYSPINSLSKKLKKQENETILTLKKTPDILAAVAALKDKPYVVGFAAETHDLEQFAKAKLKNKGLDMIAANWVGQREGGFEDDRNALTVFWHRGTHRLEMAPKKILAQRLLELIAKRYDEQSSAKNT